MAKRFQKCGHSWFLSIWQRNCVSLLRYWRESWSIKLTHLNQQRNHQHTISTRNVLDDPAWRPTEHEFYIMKVFGKDTSNMKYLSADRVGLPPPFLVEWMGQHGSPSFSRKSIETVSMHCFVHDSHLLIINCISLFPGCFVHPRLQYVQRQTVQRF